MRKVLYLDVEWANSKNKSICQMGILLKDLDTDQLFAPQLRLYINPKDKFDTHCVAVHQITESIVKDCKSFDEVWPNIQEYFTNSIIVGHNVASSDLNALVKNLTRYNIDIPELWYIDTYQLARQLIPPFEVENYQLTTLCQYLNIPLENAHDAFDDAKACSDLLPKLINEYQINIDHYVQRYHAQIINQPFIPYITNVEFRREINVLYGVVSGIEMDNIIQEEEKNYLIKWKNDHLAYADYEEASFVIEILDDILEDNKVTLNEINRLKSEITRYLQYVSTSKETLATQYLQGIIEGIAADGVIKEIEIRKLNQWLYQNDYLEGHYPYNRIVNFISLILEDNLITNDEKNDLVELFKELANPLETAKKNVVEFENKTFVLSGDFIHGKKKDVETYIISKGGTIHKNVKKATNYVVVGSLGSDAYSNGTYGTKVKKAMELNIPVLKEDQIY